MIDTVRVSSVVSEIKECEFDKVIKTVDQKTGELKIKFVTISGVRLTYYPHAKEKGTLTAEVSLPKLVKGNNFELLNDSEIEKGLDLISERVNGVCKCKGLDGWHVSRLDAVASWKMGEKKQDYIRYFRTCPVTGYVLTGYTAGKKEIGSTWIAKSRRVNAYDKDAEVGEDLGGILRLEIQNRNSGSVRNLAKRIKVDQTVDKLINNDVARAELSRWIKRAGIQAFQDSSDGFYDYLLEKFGEKASEIYFFYVGFKKHGPALKGLAGYSDSTYYRYKAAIDEIGEKKIDNKFEKLEV